MTEKEYHTKEMTPKRYKMYIWMEVFFLAITLIAILASVNSPETTIPLSIFFVILLGFLTATLYQRNVAKKSKK